MEWERDFVSTAHLSGLDGPLDVGCFGSQCGDVLNVENCGPPIDIPMGPCRSMGPTGDTLGESTHRKVHVPKSLELHGEACHPWRARALEHLGTLEVAAESDIS